MIDGIYDYQNEKHDIIALIDYNVRDILSGFIFYQDYLNLVLIKRQQQVSDEKDWKLLNTEVMARITRYIESMQIGIEEINIMAQIVKFYKLMIAYSVKLRLQMRRMLEENSWIKLEVRRLQNKLDKLEADVTSAESEKLHYQFLYKMRNIKKFEEQYLGYLLGGDDEDDTDPEEEVPMNVRAVHNLCMDYIREKRYEIALPLIEEHQLQRKGEVGEYNNDVATLYSILGKIYKSQGNFEKSQTYYEKSLKIREKVLGKESNGAGITLTNLAHVLFKRNNFREAEKMAQQALKIREKHLGKSHVDIALLHSHLGAYYINLEKWTECLEHYRKSMSIFEQIFDNSDKLILRAHIHMAKASIELKQNEKTAELLNSICVGYRDKSNIKNPETVFQAAKNCAEGIMKPFTSESLFETFGSYENVIDKESLAVMIKYFKSIKKPTISDVLTEWLEDSVDDIKIDLRQTERPSMRRSIVILNTSSFLSELSKNSQKDKTVIRTASSASGTSKKEKSGIINFFSKKKDS